MDLDAAADQVCCSCAALHAANAIFVATSSGLYRRNFNGKEKKPGWLGSEPNRKLLYCGCCRSAQSKEAVAVFLLEPARGLSAVIQIYTKSFTNGTPFIHNIAF